MTKTLLEKLGFVPGRRSLIADLPPALEPPFAAALAALGTPPDWLIGFAADQAALTQTITRLAPLYPRGGHLWFAYPKLSSGVKTDITRDRGWQASESLGLLPVTQIAVDPTWSALRFRWRDEIKTLTRRF